MGSDTLQKAFLRSRANSIEGGTTEVMKNILGEHEFSVSPVTYASIATFPGPRYPAADPWSAMSLRRGRESPLLELIE